MHVPQLFKRRYKRTFTRSSTSEPLKGKAPLGRLPLSERAHFLHGAVVLNKLKTDNEQEGLAKQDAESRLQEYGENLLDDFGGVSAVKILLRQIANAMTLVLIAAMALSFGVQDYIEGSVITAVIVANVIIGFFQEYSAEKSMASLRSLSAPTARVTRSGETFTVPAKLLVPGDIVSIKSGDAVPADMRLLNVSNLECDEALLTGEALPVAKDVEAFVVPPDLGDSDLPVGDRTNMVFSSTIVTKGRAVGVVVATGMATQVGAISAAMQRKKSSRGTADNEGGEALASFWKRGYERVMVLLGLRSGTPLQIKLAKLAYLLFLGAILLCIVVFGAARFEVTKEVAIYGIALGIAIIPECIIAVLTVTMAAGTSRMAKQHVIVRRLASIEALGGVTDICSDKTGTLTQGKMVVKSVWMPLEGNSAMPLIAAKQELPRWGKEYDVVAGSDAFSVEGDIREVQPSGVAGDIVTPDKLRNQLHGLRELAMCASMCNVASLTKGKNGQWSSSGDPTEVALQVFAHKLGMPRPSLASLTRSEEVAGTFNTEKMASEEGGMRKGIWKPRYELVVEYPFDSSVKRMSMLYHDQENPDMTVILLKGSVERVLDACTAYIAEQKPNEVSGSPITDDFRQKTLAIVDTLAGRGLRVIALASRRTPFPDMGTSKTPKNLSRDAVERDCHFLGLVGIHDPPRLETVRAIRSCKDAGITVHMLTGDHPATAAVIAREVEIVGADSPQGTIMTASEFNRLTDAEIDKLTRLPLVIARCDPETKVRMIEAGARRGLFMAMTGDGVNDAPSLKFAPVGIGMGMEGSDVAKEASDLVLTDDNFDSIRAAVSEGRRTFDNIQRFVCHLLAVNVAEVIVLVIGLAFVDDSGHNVFPLSPLAILWINMLTSGPPAFGLGLEPPSDDIMRRPPHSIKMGIFTWPVVIDCFFYGTIMGMTSILSFVTVIWGNNDGQLGIDCNEAESDICIPVYRARATVFASLVLQILVYAWELKSMNRSMFNITPGRAFYKDIWANQVLFWAVFLGMLTVPVTLYVPGLNDKALRQTGIGWEWGIVAGMTTTFVVCAELWKILVRRKPWYLNLGNKNECEKGQQQV